MSIFNRLKGPRNPLKFFRRGSDNQGEATIMVISAYQVNNVLRVYGDQLRQNRVSNRPNRTEICSPASINISAKAKRKAIIDKIASEIVDRITEHGPHDDVEKEVFEKLENECGVHLAVGGEASNDLVFKVIDESGETINSLSIEDSKFLRYKLQEITKETVDKNMM